ncbi:MAG TPA: TadE/TadG family type IV pilus assembly protein [Roseiflexaceae bacterium]
MPKHLRAKGQALVEFALTATLLFFLLAATVDLGLIFFTLQGLHNAAQEGGTYGSRWLKTVNGVGQLDYYAIRDHVRHEAGDQGIGFANLLDLNNNGIDDFTEDSAHMGDPSGTSLFPTYIQINALFDTNGDGDPTNDNTPCTSVVDNTQPCFLQVIVSADYNFLFPLAPSFANQRRLTSSYVIPMRSGYSQGGAPTNSPVIVTTTPSPTPTLAPTPTPCVKTVPNFNNTLWNNAAGTWSGAGFTGAVVNGGGSSNFTINTQSLPAGTSEPCSSSITLGP